MVPWGQVITGVVGLAGIGGAILSAVIAGRSANRVTQLNISAEDRRAKRNDKQNIYATCLAAFVEMTGAVVQYRARVKLLGSAVDNEDIVRQEWVKARDEMYKATTLLDLAGSDEVARLANKLRSLFMDYHKSEEADPGEIARVRGDLSNAMRADLDGTDS